MSGSELENRYRRLLAWYPWSHRRVYEDEMLAVLVAGARPGQRRPTLAEAANLVTSGLAARARTAFSGPAGPAWADAAAVFGLLAAMALLSQRVVRSFERVAADPGAPSGMPLYLLAAGWAAVVLAALIGLRHPAAALAWFTVLGQAFLVAEQYGSYPVSAVNLLGPLALGVVAAAALSVPAPRRRALAVLRAPRLLAFVLGIATAQTILFVNRYQRAHPTTEGRVSYQWFGLESSSEVVVYLWLAGIVAGVVAAGLAALTLPMAVRWRLAALAAPVVALGAMIELTLEGWAYSNMHMGHPVYLAPVQWVLLVAVPLVAFGLSACLVRWREQSARLTALGRAADRAAVRP